MFESPKFLRWGIDQRRDWFYAIFYLIIGLLIARARHASCIEDSSKSKSAFVAP
ncbi:hypothetical protein PMIT1313_02520 [Prochlorococcus marinus str. MIT 1313]|nr:hypothetical protein PMIT1313_02520 [Prochlorococcus marinus str. MIT 1313]KZR70866.1 hypothetical protein PMIT1318_02007 [Prochlorococcus marinus str. MIT 1318]